MKRLSVDELRELYLRFFEQKHHKRLPSASLVPHGDPTMLLTSAGMVPFKPYYLGQEQPEHSRITTCQRCLRTPDIDHVGHTDRHGTLFEMLGNFSFGDYFKKEAIEFAWEFVTEQLQLAPDTIWVTIFHNDDEAFTIWNEHIGVPAERIVRLGREDNFWEIGVGPCGPCSEIFVDRGGGCGRDDCRPGCSHCERFFEIWNLVFIEYDQDEDGNLHELDTKGIDTGMGLERTAAFLQGVSSIFEVDTIRPILDYVAQRAGTSYDQDDTKDISLRVITDHMRGVTLLVMDGVLPSNEGRGYVLRRLLRRAVRHVRLLGVEEQILTDVADKVREHMRTAYPELEREFPRIKQVIAREEQRFYETLDQGVDLLHQVLDKLAEEKSTVISGEEAFRLYDTYGFPLELTEEIAADRGVTVDKDGFALAMERQRERARAARGNVGYLGESRSFTPMGDDIPTTEFVGYDVTACETEIVALFQKGQRVDHTDDVDEEVDVILRTTPFYPEGGGQVSDTGTIVTEGGTIQVEHAERVAENRIIHKGRLVKGTVHVGARVTVTTDKAKRIDTERHHTGTHLLHKALRDVLGEHVTQAGSLVAPDRLRFDFTHFEPLSPKQKRAVEKEINNRILAGLPVTALETERAAAERMGAMALFGEKYGERVRMVSIGDYSHELCGGTHVHNTSELGLFRIVSEGSVASGVRRIEAVAGRHAYEHIVSEEDALHKAATLLQVGTLEVPDQVQRLSDELRYLEREVERLQQRLSQVSATELEKLAENVNGINILATKVDAADMQSLRTIGDALRESLKPCALVIGASDGQKVFLVAMASDEAIEKGLQANNVVRSVAPIVEGGGGGNPNTAQAGGKTPEKLDEAMQAALETMRQILES